MFQLETKDTMTCPFPLLSLGSPRGCPEGYEPSSPMCCTPKGEWEIKSANDLSPEDKEDILHMAKSTYEGAGLTFHHTLEHLFEEYPCILYAFRSSTHDHRLRAALLFEPRPLANKISMTIHDGTREMKEAITREKAKLMNTPGFIQEASGAPSWLYRSRYHLSPIMNVEKIARILNRPVSDIVLNPKFTMQDKNEQVYHRASSRGVPVAESLFGTPCEAPYQWSTSGASCHRQCIRGLRPL